MQISDHPVAFDVLLTRAAAVTLAATLVWVLAIAAAIVAEALSGGRFRGAAALGCPQRCHRWALGALSTLLTAGLLAPPMAHADPVGAGALDGLQLPDRPDGTGSEIVGARPRAHQSASVSAWVRVRVGDSLWRISQRRLPPDATPDQIAALSRHLYAHNRAAIGVSPDVIHPGQFLAVSPSAHETASEDS